MLLERVVAVLTGTPEGSGSVTTIARYPEEQSGCHEGPNQEPFLDLFAIDDKREGAPANERETIEILSVPTQAIG